MQFINCRDPLSRISHARLFSKISVLFFQEHLFLATEQIPIFKEHLFATEQITISGLGSCFRISANLLYLYLYLCEGSRK